MLPLEIVLSPPGIPLEGGGACLLLGYWACCLAPGVQGEGEVRTNGNGEVEDLALAGQCLAKVQALHEQGGANFGHCSHFGFTSESVKSRRECWACCHSILYAIYLDEKCLLATSSNNLG